MNDVPTAIKLGKRATKYGMKVCIDFHYSDFWADPKRQHTPKAWEGMDLEEKSNALYNFTKDSLKQMLDAGLYYGGSAWDNQAFFDFEGHPLESLKLFNYLKEGTK